MSKTKIRLSTLIVITALLVACSGPTPVRAHAIILFIGDGMGEAHRTAGRWQALGQDGTLAMDAMEFSSWTSTADVHGFVTDSAAAGTALATGTKTGYGVIGQDVDGNRLTTILEQAQAKGMAVGLVSNTAIAHATPAAFAAHVSDRYMTTEIADQMLTAKVDVLLGGGESDFLPPLTTGCYPGYGFRWEDERDLIAEAVDNGYTYVCSAAELAAVDPTSTTHLVGLFGDGGMTRPFSPTLAEMTQQAISVLSQDPDGFFLMVEGGQIDWAAHYNDAANVISDVIELDEAVAVAQAYAATVDNVLIIVTADHETGGMSVSLTADGSFSEDGPLCPTRHLSTSIGVRMTTLRPTCRLRLKGHAQACWPGPTKTPTSTMSCRRRWMLALDPPAIAALSSEIEGRIDPFRRTLRPVSRLSLPRSGTRSSTAATLRTSFGQIGLSLELAHIQVMIEPALVQ